MPRLKTIRAFVEWVKDEANIAELFRLIVEDRMRLRDACMKLGRPYTLVYPFLHDGGAMQKRYEGALAALADDLMHERLQIADGVKGSKNPVAVAAAKLRCEVREGNAAKWGKERYGEAFEASKGPAVVIQVADLRGATVAVQGPAPMPALEVQDAEPAT